MTDHILAGLRAKTERHGGDLTLTFDEETQVLTAEFFRQDHGDYSYASETRHFRLTEVKQVWQEVTGD